MGIYRHSVSQKVPGYGLATKRCFLGQPLFVLLTKIKLSYCESEIVKYSSFTLEAVQPSVFDVKLKVALMLNQTPKAIASLVKPKQEINLIIAIVVKSVVRPASTTKPSDFLMNTARNGDFNENCLTCLRPL
jgi:hypothetical protein